MHSPMPCAFFTWTLCSRRVRLKVDFDMALLVLASGLYCLIAQRMRGYGMPKPGKSYAT